MEEMDQEKLESEQAEPVLHQSPVPKKDRFLPISIIVAAVLVAGAVVFATLYKGAPAAAPAATANGTSTATAAAGGISSSTMATLMTLTPQDAILGNANAPVTLIEYGDYQCPFCVAFFAETQSQIVTNYVNTGKVKMVFRDFPFLDREQGLPATANESHDAAAAALCAQDQNEFWPYHDALYAAKEGDEETQASKGNQSAENDGFYTEALFVSIAQNLKLNISTFTNCIESGKYTNEVNQEQAAAATAGIDSTPTFLVNGQEISGAEPYSVFQTALDAAAARQ